jgi:cellulose synthase/poly-beta-1,6-N-acetylglucosamine synthase-like glycosyltransferase
MVEFIVATQWFFLAYFVALQLGYVVLNLLSFGVLRNYMQSTSVDRLSQVFSGLEPPVTICVPAYNEAQTIVASLRSLLQLNYPEYEIVVCNDGSKDATLEILKREFQLVEYPETRAAAIATAPVRGYYRSKTRPNLRVVDKENGGRADALNAAINIGQYPLCCAIDADSILQRDSLYLVVQPFLTDPSVVAAGGTIRVANGCEVRDGFLVGVGLPRNLIALFQIVEYLRAFLFGRVGWNRMNALLIISGAFGVFRREVITNAGGYRPDTLGEDMELTVRLHRLLRAQGKPYRITFVPDPVCWTEVPQDLRTLGEPVVEPRAAHRRPRRHGRLGRLSVRGDLRVAGTDPRAGGLRVHAAGVVFRRDLAGRLRRIPARRDRHGRAGIRDRAAAGGDVVPPLSEAAPVLGAAGRGGDREPGLPPAHHALAPAGAVPVAVPSQGRVGRDETLGRVAEERLIAKHK